MKKLLIAFFSGTLFGLGLCASQMVNPQKVIAFLDITGDWDPSLGVVMIGALTVTMISFRFILRRPKPILADAFGITKLKEITPRLIGGGILFGIGWGLAGICPGPAVAGLVFGLPKSVIFFITMLVGMTLYQFTLGRGPTSTSKD